jgi:hypothetical protein
LFRMRQSIEETVFAVDVEVDEVGHGFQVKSEKRKT